MKCFLFTLTSKNTMHDVMNGKFAIIRCSLLVHSYRYSYIPCEHADRAIVILYPCSCVYSLACSVGSSDFSLADIILLTHTIALLSVDSVCACIPKGFNLLPYLHFLTTV